MMLYLPKKFDLNEWYVILAFGIVAVAAPRLPKTLTSVETTFILLYNVYLGFTVDFLLAGPPFDLYNMNDRPQYEISDAVLYILTYPLAAYIMLSVYARWKWKGFRRALYIGGWAATCLLLEWAGESARAFTYKGWSLRYSFIVYLGVYTSNILMYHLALRLSRRKNAA